MTLAQAPLLTNGATHSAQTFRMMIRDLARGSEGVTEGNDLKVTPLTVPGGAVLVGDGSGIIRGRAVPWQGHYTAYNVGTEQVAIAPTGATPRSDLIVLRVLDPEYEGGRNPATDRIVFFDVVSGVSATTTTPPSGYSAIALARIDLPANTGTVTAAMIVDLRKVANPRRERSLRTAFPTASSTLAYSDNQWHTWPTNARWNVPVPPWATTATIVTTVTSIALRRADVFGLMRNVIGSATTQHIAIDDDQGSGTRRNTLVIADSLTLPAALRGTTAPIYLQTFMSRAETGDIVVDGATTFILDIEFNEGAM